MAETMMLRIKPIADGQWHTYVHRVDAEGHETTWCDGKELVHADWNAMLRGFWAGTDGC